MIVKCARCGVQREIKSGEIDDDDYPMCPKCFMPMFPVKVINKKEKRK